MPIFIENDILLKKDLIIQSLIHLFFYQRGVISWKRKNYLFLNKFRICAKKELLLKLLAKNLLIIFLNITTISSYLWSIKFLRNAAAHNNCLLNSLKAPYHITIHKTKEIQLEVSKIKTISSN